MAIGDADSKPESEPQDQGDAATPRSPQRLRPWSALEFRDFRMLWFSSVAAMLTMQMRMLVTTVWLYNATGSGLSLGLLGVIQLAVQLPAIIYGGTLADQVDRKKLMAFTQAFSFLLISVMAALVFVDKLNAFHIYAVTAILGVTSVLGSPARSALTANVVPKTHLMHAVTLNTAIFQIGAVVAPLGFAAIHELFGIKIAFIAAAILAFPSSFLPLLIRARTLPENRDEDTSVIRRMWEGFVFIRSHPILPGLYIMDIGVTVVSFYRQILPLVVDRLFKGGAATVGILQSANSFGGVAGTFAVLFLAKYRAKGMLVIYATLAYGALLILFGLSTSLLVGAIVIIGLGATDAIGMTTRQTTVQLTTPDHMRGRAVSFSSVAAMSANNIGTFEVGFMSDAVGAPNTMIIGGTVSILVVLIVWRLVKGIREYRYP